MALGILMCVYHRLTISVTLALLSLMWSWLVILLILYHLIRWPLDMWWVVWAISWVQVSVLMSLLPCYATPPKGHWIFKTSMALTTIFSMGMWIKKEDLHTVAIVTGIAVIYGASSYHNLMEFQTHHRSFPMRSWRIWNILHRYYHLEVWRERRGRHAINNNNKNTASYNAIDNLHRLWLVSCKPHCYYRPWGSKSPKVSLLSKPSKIALPSLWIAHPHGSGSTSILLAFAFPGTAVDTSTHGPILVAIDNGYFAVPIMREVLIWAGCISAEAHCIKKALLDGNSVVVAPGLYNESLTATFAQFSIYTAYTKELLEDAAKLNTPIRPLVVLGDNESINAFRWWDILRLFAWNKLALRLPGVTWPFWTPVRRLIVGHYITDNQTHVLFYQRWLMLFDESRCALRQAEEYYKSEGAEDDTMALLRSGCERPLQPRSRKALYDHDVTTHKTEESSIIIELDES